MDLTSLLGGGGGGSGIGPSSSATASNVFGNQGGISNSLLALAAVAIVGLIALVMTRN